MTDASSNVYANDFITTSDRRIKSDIKQINNVLDIFNDINLYSFEKEGSTRREVGLIAQEVYEGNPLFTGTDFHPKYDEVLTLSAHHIASLAAGGVKGLITRTNSMMSETQKLKKKVSKLEQEIKELKNSGNK